jgi:hypothetical protein
MASCHESTDSNSAGRLAMADRLERPAQTGSHLTCRAMKSYQQGTMQRGKPMPGRTMMNLQGGRAKGGRLFALSTPAECSVCYGTGGRKLCLQPPGGDADSGLLAISTHRTRKTGTMISPPAWNWAHHWAIMPGVHLWATGRQAATRAAFSGPGDGSASGWLHGGRLEAGCW